jgi:hypothetical protein
VPASLDQDLLIAWSVPLFSRPEDTMRTLAPLLLTLPFFLSACVNDYELMHVVPSPDDVPVALPAPPIPPTAPPAPPAPPSPPNSPWPPEVGTVPDLYFAVAWSDTPCYTPDHLWGDGLEQSSRSDLVGVCDARNVAVVNMFGEVVDEFTPPSLQEGEVSEFLQLVNAGHGQFLHVFNRFSYDTADASEFYSGSPWEAWRGDSYTGEHLLVANWDYNNQQLFLPQAQRHLDVGGSASYLQLGVLPTEPDQLVTWRSQSGCGPSTQVQPLQVADMFDGSLLNVGWQPEEFLPVEVYEQVDNPSNWNMDLSLTEDGELSALFGVTTGGCSGLPEDPSTPTLVSWSPQSDSNWYAPTELGWQSQKATYAGWSGTGALNLVGDGGTQRWRVTTPSAVSEGALSPSLSGYKPGPVIDPMGPTFTVIGTDINNWDGDSLDFYHQGQVVWSIDKLKFGLQERRVYFADVILLSQQPAE